MFKLKFDVKGINAFIFDFFFTIEMNFQGFFKKEKKNWVSNDIFSIQSMDPENIKKSILFESDYIKWKIF